MLVSRVTIGFQGQHVALRVRSIHHASENNYEATAALDISSGLAIDDGKSLASLPCTMLVIAKNHFAVTAHWALSRYLQCKAETALCNSE